jgi:hypothetical protein
MEKKTYQGERWDAGQNDLDGGMESRRSVNF